MVVAPRRVSTAGEIVGPTRQASCQPSHGPNHLYYHYLARIADRFHTGLQWIITLCLQWIVTSATAGPRILAATPFVLIP